MDVRDIARQIVAREGGYVNDPDDPGGPTKYGVTLTTLRRFGRDLTGDGQIGIDDLKSMSRDMAVEIYVRHYHNAPRIALLPEALRPSVFDMYVNAGARAVTLLQRLLVEMGYDIAIDGAIGPQTGGAAAQAAQVNEGALVDAYGIARRNYYLRLADHRPASRKYARSRKGGKGGWIKRAEEFISPIHHMTDEQFQDRVATWG